MSPEEEERSGGRFEACEKCGLLSQDFFSLKKKHPCFFCFIFCSERRYFANLAGFGGITLDEWSQIAGKVQKTDKFHGNREI